MKKQILVFSILSIFGFSNFKTPNKPTVSCYTYYYHCINVSGGGSFVGCDGSMAAQYAANSICSFLENTM